MNGAPSRETVFDAATGLFTTTSPEGRIAAQRVDAVGRTTELQVGDFLPIHFEYDARGRLAFLRQGSGADERVTELQYDTSGDLERLIDPRGQATAFTYDAAERVRFVTRPGVDEVELAYDVNGNLSRLTPPGKPLHAFAYTPIDQEERYEPPAVPGVANPATTTAYNLDRQIEDVTLPDGGVLDLVYESGPVPTDRLASLAIPRGTTTFGYDPATGQLATIAAPGGQSLAFGYDGAFPTSATWSGPVTGSVSRTLNDRLLTATEQVNGAFPVTFTYDADELLTAAGALALFRDPVHGLLVATELGDVATARDYTPFAELAFFEAAHASAGLLYREEIPQRDKLGRILQRVETVGGTTTTTDYGYDPAGRLETVHTNGALTATYTYDANGNRTSLTTPSETRTATVDAQDRLLSYGDLTFTYGANGELATRTDTATGKTTTYTYDALGNLTQVLLPTEPTTTTIDYVIDGRSRRVGKRVDGSLVQGFLYRDQINPVAELDAAGNVVSRFVYASQPHVPDYLVKAGETYRLVSDPLGSVRLVVNVTTGAIVQRIDYDEFGRVTQDTNPGFQPFGFAGGLYDPDTGLVRFGARDYDSEVGRWITKDPIRFDGGSQNLYGYVLSDPVNFSDPEGLFNPAKGLAALAAAANSGRLYASGALKLLAAAGATGTGVGATAGAGTTAIGLWNLRSAHSAQQQAYQLWAEALAEPASASSARNLLGALPFGTQFDDPCEPTIGQFLKGQFANAKGNAAAILTEFGKLLP